MESPLDVPDPPADLTSAEREVWLTLAPHAVAAGTLLPATVFDFRTLVQLTVEASELLEARRAAGWGDAGRALATAYRHAVQRQESKLRGFGLSPIGKRLPDAPPVAELDDWEFDTPPTLGNYKA